MFDSDFDEDASVLNRDFLWCMLGIFVILVMLFIAHLAVKGKTQDDASEPPGQVMVEIRWADGLDADVDLWVQAPGDVAVGYSNKGGKVFNLLRDDLGSRHDALALNYENAYSRGIAPGEYTVNLHHYRGPAPIEVQVQVSIRTANGTGALPKLSRTVTLDKSEERTALRFTLDDFGNIRPGSVHTLQRPIRNGRQ